MCKCTNHFWKHLWREAKVILIIYAPVSGDPRHIRFSFPEASSVHYALCDSTLFTAALPLFRLSLKLIFVTLLWKILSNEFHCTVNHLLMCTTCLIPFTLTLISIFWRFKVHDHLDHLVIFINALFLRQLRNFSSSIIYSKDIFEKQK